MALRTPPLAPRTTDEVVDELRIGRPLEERLRREDLLAQLHGAPALQRRLALARELYVEFLPGRASARRPDQATSPSF